LDLSLLAVAVAVVVRRGRRALLVALVDQVVEVLALP
jgi:hypothetical protein